MGESIRTISLSSGVVIGTPGRLADIFDQNILNLSFVKTVVLDEADMLLKEGFFPDIDRFVLRINHPQFIVCSATLEANLGHELEKYIGADQLVINEEIMTSSSVEHLLVDVGHQDVNHAVLSIIKENNLTKQSPPSVIIPEFIVIFGILSLNINVVIPAII